MIDVGASAQPEIDILASLALAFIITFPILAYAALRLISQVMPGKKPMMGYVISAAALFYIGALFGSYFAGYYIVSQTPFNIILPIIRTVDALDFYQGVLSIAIAFGLALSIPVFLIAVAKLGAGLARQAERDEPSAHLKNSIMN